MGEKGNSYKEKTACSSKLRLKFESLRREIKADFWKQNPLCVNNLVYTVKANPIYLYRYTNTKIDTFLFGLMFYVPVKH